MPGYYDIDDILMEEEVILWLFYRLLVCLHKYDLNVFLLLLQPISVVFQVSANGVGLLDPGAERNSVSDFCTYGLLLWCNFLGHLLTFLPPSLLF